MGVVRRYMTKGAEMSSLLSVNSAVTKVFS